MPDRRRENVLPPLPARFRLTPEFRLLVASTWIAPEGQPQQRVGRVIPNPPPELDRENGALGITRPTPYAQTQAERVRVACHEGIDWDEFVSLVDRHRVLVPHDELRRLVGDRLPDRVYEQLKSRSAEACRCALRQAAELVRLHRAFGAHGIEMIPMKGVMLSVQLFGDPAMRSTRDLDLLVRPERLDEADQILRGEGYRRTDPDCELTPKRKKWILGCSHHFSYYHDQRRQLVELHWRLLLWKTEHVAELWNHCQPMTWMGASFLALKDDALLLFLCHHGSFHQWRRIKWLGDVVALLAQERSFRWGNLPALANRFDVSRPLAQAGMLVHWLYGIPLPAPLVELILRQKLAGDLASKAVEAMFLSEEGQFALPVRLKNGVFPARLRERLPRRVSLRSCLIAPYEFKECPLPDKLFWLYFPLRPLLWFYHHYIRKRASSKGGGAAVSTGSRR
jgi:hypothetical protein